MINKVLIGIITAVLVGVFWWLISVLRLMIDRKKVYEWLHANTRDEPYESHVSNETLAKGICISESRTRQACMSDPRIYYFQNQLECWSIWRKEPQSIYEKKETVKTF